MSTATKTTDHDKIRRWIEERGGRPSRVADSARGGKGGGILRVDFQERDEGLEELDWPEFFRIFDENGLAFLHQDRTEDGEKSRFNKFVDREGQ